MCLYVRCLEQFAHLNFIQSTPCMSLRDPAGLQPGSAFAEANLAELHGPGLTRKGDSDGSGCAERTGLWAFPFRSESHS